MNRAATATELERVPCYSCGAWRGDEWGEEAGFTAVKCAGCGLVYVTPRPSLATIDEAAQTGEHRTERGSFSAVGHFRAHRVRAHVRTIRRTFGDIDRHQPLRWLDIGAGFGELAKAATQAFPNSRVTAIEPNAAKRREAAKHGVQLSDMPLRQLPRAGFDVVSLINVWSHLPDPPSFLDQISSLLVPTGWLLLETGAGAELKSAADYPGPLLLPDHLSFAGERHVSELIERAGFEVETVHRQRADTLRFATTFAARRLLGRPGGFVLPYRSPFRVLQVRARRAA